jgi:nitroimidazol reductase NimA-like FMN-containing flavoprotein (pyridoxamine 5'-phosphate oxidase superfamily)
MIRELQYSEIEEVLQDQVIGRIGCSQNGKTYIVPVSFAYNDPYVYIHSMEGRKLDVMRSNAEICFEVDEIEDILNWKSVIAWGIFEELTENQERQKAWKFLTDRSVPIITTGAAALDHNRERDYDNVNEIEGVFYRIELTEKSGRSESSFPASDFSPMQEPTF